MATITRPTGRRVVQQVSPRSAARFAFVYTVTLSAILIVGFGALYLLGMVSGALASFEGFIESLGWEDFRLRYFRLLPVFMLVGLIASAIATGIAVVGAVIFNAVSDVIGGVEVTTRER